MAAGRKNGRQFPGSKTLVGFCLYHTLVRLQTHLFAKTVVGTVVVVVDY